jgi:hypothetical protein
VSAAAGLQDPPLAAHARADRNAHGAFDAAGFVAAFVKSTPAHDLPLQFACFMVARRSGAPGRVTDGHR